MFKNLLLLTVSLIAGLAAVEIALRLTVPERQMNAPKLMNGRATYEPNQKQRSRYLEWDYEIRINADGFRNDRVLAVSSCAFRLSDLSYEPGKTSRGVSDIRRRASAVLAALLSPRSNRRSDSICTITSTYRPVVVSLIRSTCSTSALPCLLFIDIPPKD